MAKGSRARAGSVRIIGGQWRGRKLAVTDREGLRPTTDRIRETLFNWLAPELAGSRCLDLFAGTGALGLEALSRGAAFCRFIENSGQVASQLQQNLDILKCDTAALSVTDALSVLAQGPGSAASYDIVFLDPPFHKQLLEPSCAALESYAWLAPSACIYLETSTREPEPILPENWMPSRDKTAGEVRYRLFVRQDQFG